MTSMKAHNLSPLNYTETMHFISKAIKMVTPVSHSSSAISVGPMDIADLNSRLSIVQRQSKNDSALVDICVSIQPPSREATVRGPSDVCCVIDVSGSMTSSASVSQAEDSGLSVLDVVKHAVNTIIQSLGSSDRLSVVTFSDEAKVLFANIQMDTAGKEKVKNQVNALCTEGRTNLWAGLLRGMNILNSANNEAATASSTTGARNTSLFLLTDGVPNVDPAGGYLRAMQRFKDENGGHYPGSIHTFGFGYSLKSALLHEIAMEGNGTYNFIPDAGFVGTAFVNTLANQLTSYGTQTTLSLQLLGEEVTLVESSLPPNGSHMATSWGVNFNVGNLLFGQQRDFVLQVRLPESGTMSEVEVSTVPLIEAVVKYKPLFVPSGEDQMSIDQADLDTSLHGVLNLEAHMFRASLIQDLSNGYIIQNTATSREVMLATAMQAWHAQTSAESDGSPATTRLLAYVSGLLEDLTGQIRMAHSEATHHSKWGTHYLPSLRCAHQRQQCNNFKDPGVQHYGGALFQQIRDTAEEVFLSLPPPKPSRGRGGRGSGGSSSRPVLSNMSAYHNASAGCFEGSGRVTLADGTTKLIRDILPGDRVQCDITTQQQDTMDMMVVGHTSSTAPPLITAVVECVVQTKCSHSQSAEFVQMPNGPLLTPWHPVWCDGRWQFPMDVTGTSKVLKAEFVYNFVLGATSRTDRSFISSSRSEESEATEAAAGRRGQSMVVEGMKCITLAHGIEDDPVATHEFYGTESVLGALQQYPGYAEEGGGGVVVMDERQVQRNADTGLVCGFGQHQQEDEDVVSQSE
jgi:hypothetical protein